MIPTAFEELSSSPSSSEMSIAKENRLSRESCSWKRKKISHPKSSINNAKSNESSDLLALEQFLVSGVKMKLALYWLKLPMGCLRLKISRGVYNL